MQITGELVTLFVIILTAIAGVWYKVELKIDAAKDKAEAAAAELALYKTHIAENYITKSGLREFRDEIMHGIRATASGRVYLCQGAAASMLDSYRRTRSTGLRSRGPRGQLGDRESQVLRLIADGYSSKEIARNLHIAPSTVEVHRRNIMRKLGLHKAADLTRFAIRHHMISM